jgi:hypothetical protein
LDYQWKEEITKLFFETIYVGEVFGGRGDFTNSFKEIYVDIEINRSDL